MDYKQILNIAVLAGEIMLRSGAETYRVEDTMKHILNTAGTEVAEAFVMMTGIVATLDNQDMEMLTAMRRVHDRGTNMHRIVQVNEISRRYCRGEMTVEETYKELKQIKGKQYSVAVYNLATILVPVGFAPLWRGSERDSGLCGSRMYPGIFDYTGQKNPDEQLYFECNLCIRGSSDSCLCE